MALVDLAMVEKFASIHSSLLENSVHMFSLRTADLVDDGLIKSTDLPDIETMLETF
jgi:hypothetical protein